MTDTERLDWLEENQWDVITNVRGGQRYWYVGDASGDMMGEELSCATSLRESIDEAKRRSTTIGREQA